jgi:hypothetical protein
LTCVDCGKTICSGCLVQCPVGFRCGECGGGPKSAKAAAKPANFLIVARSLITCGFFGFLFGVLEPYIDLPFVGVFICLAVGMMAGKLAFPIVTDHRIGNGATVTMIFGLLIGMSFTILALVFAATLSAIGYAFTSSPESIVPAMWSFISFIFSPVAFIVGFWRMTTWRWY